MMSTLEQQIALETPCVLSWKQLVREPLLVAAAGCCFSLSRKANAAQGVCLYAKEGS